MTDETTYRPRRSGSIRGTTRVTASVRARAKENLSQRLLATAQDLAGECERIEQEQGVLDWPQKGWERRLQGLAITTVVTAVAALEASINEFYREAVDRNRNALKSLTDDQMGLLEALWPTVERSRGIIDKYQVALTACGKHLDKGAEPWQSTAGLVRLRNALAHFKPEWRDQQREHGRLEEILSNKFAENALAQKATGRMTWFAGRCLGAGCARWACDTVAMFANDFSTKLGIRDRF